MTTEPPTPRTSGGANGGEPIDDNNITTGQEDTYNIDVATMATLADGTTAITVEGVVFDYAMDLASAVEGGTAGAYVLLFGEEETGSDGTTYMSYVLYDEATGTAENPVLWRTCVKLPRLCGPVANRLV